MSGGELPIRTVREGDDAVLASVADDVFDHAVRPELVAEFLADPRHHLVVALDAGRVVGFASGVHYVHPDKPAELFVNEVGVASTHRRRGLGRRLLDALLDEGRAHGCREAWVGTEPDNRAARALYASAGGDPEAEPFVVYEFDLEG